MYKIVLVEDEDIIRNTLYRTIDWAGLDCYICALCRSAEEGLKEISEYQPQIVITDIKLPKKNGIQMLSEAQSICNFQSIIISGYAEFEYAKKAIELSVVDYILKPIDEELLKATIQKAILRIKGSSKKDKSNDDESFNSFINELLESTKDSTVISVLNEIALSYADNLSLKKISDNLCLSCGYVSRHLKEVLGLSFIFILQKHRVEVSKTLICSDSRLKNYEIAEKCGFGNYKHFCSVFKKITGITPMEYKKQYYGGKTI